jgi:glutathione synthase
VKDLETVALLRASFTGLYPLDNSPEGLAAYEAALKNSDDLVMKPQREGGGNS